MKTLEELGCSPAPWRSVYDDVLDTAFNVVCTLDGLDYNEADGWIMAAAPEMYEALAAMLHCAEAEAPWSDTSHMGIAMDMARKALAKACGEDAK